MKPKKYLGQNFLKDRAVLKKIIEAADLKPEDNVLEIGPGTGVLTEELIRRAGKIIAVEKDNSLAMRLDSRLRGNDRIKVIHGDILKINLPELLCNLKVVNSDSDKKINPSYKLPIANYEVISNIPYYITSPIIQLFLETKYPPKSMLLMVQREVAERVVAKPGQMSILAVSVQYRAKAELLFLVDKKSFWPAPEVDSAVLHITHNMKQITKEERDNFFRVVRAGFSARRKTLLNNLSNSFHLDKKATEEKIKKAGLNPTQRAQEFNLADWKKLSAEFIETPPEPK